MGFRGAPQSPVHAYFGFDGETFFANGRPVPRERYVEDPRRLLSSELEYLERVKSGWYGNYFRDSTWYFDPPDVIAQRRAERAAQSPPPT